MRNYIVDLGGDFIYRGCVDGAGEMTTIRKAKTYVSDFWGVYAVDLAPRCYAPPLRVFVCNAGGESDAIEAIMEAARDMGPPKNDNRINLFYELYGECDGADCWCQRAYGEDSQITIDGKAYHDNEGAVIGISRVTSRDQIHDGGRSTSRLKPELREERAYKRYVKSCHRENLNAHDRHMWRVHGKPTSVI